MKITICAAAMAALLAAQGAPVAADADRAGYNHRAARTDMALFRALDRAGTGVLAREVARSDLNLGPRFDDIDTNRDEIVTLQEMRAYIEKTYGVVPAAG